MAPSVPLQCCKTGSQSKAPSYQWLKTSIDMISVSPLNLKIKNWKKKKKKEKREHFKYMHRNQDNLHEELEHFKHRQTILIQMNLIHITAFSIV